MASYVPQELAEAGENGQPMSVKTQGQCGLALIVGADCPGIQSLSQIGRWMKMVQWLRLEIHFFM